MSEAKPLPLSHWIDKAAQLWCLPKHQRKKMDPDMAFSIAALALDAYNEGRRSPQEPSQSERRSAAHKISLALSNCWDLVKEHPLHGTRLNERVAEAFNLLSGIISEGGPSRGEIEARVLLAKADEYFKRARKEKLAGPEALLEQLAYELRDEAAAARGGK